MATSAVANTQNYNDKRGVNMIKVAILGYGTVGSGVFEIIRENKDLIAANAGEEIEVK